MSCRLLGKRWRRKRTARRPGRRGTMHAFVSSGEPARQTGNVPIVIEPYDRNQSLWSASVGKRAEGRPAIELGCPPDQGFGYNRPVIGVGHHHQSLTFCRKQDQVALVANILSTFHEDQGA